jgi:uncharacterized membrane protein
MHEEQMPTIRQSVTGFAFAVGTCLICLMWVGVSLISVCAVLLITSLRFLKSRFSKAKEPPNPRS